MEQNSISEDGAHAPSKRSFLKNTREKMCHQCAMDISSEGKVLSCRFPAGRVSYGHISKHRREKFGRLEDHQLYLGVVCHGGFPRLALVSGGYLRTCDGLYLPEHFVTYETFLKEVAIPIEKTRVSVIPNADYTFTVCNMGQTQKQRTTRS